MCIQNTGSYCIEFWEGKEVEGDEAVYAGDYLIECQFAVVGSGCIGETHMGWVSG